MRRAPGQLVSSREPESLPTLAVDASTETPCQARGPPKSDRRDGEAGDATARVGRGGGKGQRRVLADRAWEHLVWRRRPLAYQRDLSSSCLHPLQHQEQTPNGFGKAVIVELLFYRHVLVHIFGETVVLLLHVLFCRSGETNLRLYV